MVDVTSVFPLFPHASVKNICSITKTNVGFASKLPIDITGMRDMSILIHHALTETMVMNIEIHTMDDSLCSRRKCANGPRHVLKVLADINKEYILRYALLEI